MKSTLLRFLCLFTAFLFFESVPALAQEKPTHVKEIRTLYLNEFGIARVDGLAYSVADEHFFILDAGDPQQPGQKNPTITIVTPHEELVDTINLGFDVGAEINLVFDDGGNYLLILNPQSAELIQIAVGASGRLDPTQQTRVDITQLGLQSPQGMSIDAANGRLFIVDSAASQVVSIALDAKSVVNRATATRIDLSSLGATNLRSIALNPLNQHLYLLNTAAQTLYEVTQAGQFVASYDVADLGLVNPRDMRFAPSADLTDPPGTTHLFIADSGSAVQRGESQNTRILEVAFAPAAPSVAAVATLTPMSLVRTVNLFELVPPSPDPAGIVYLGGNRLLVSDSEVNEIDGPPPAPDLFTGDNLFEISISDPIALTRTGTTLLDPINKIYADEPTGLGFNPANGHLFVSDDTSGSGSGKGVFEIDPGPDDLYGSSDDIVLGFIDSTMFDPESKDPEGVTFDTTSGDLFIVDGIDAELYRINAGANGRFDGVPADGGDDITTNFDLKGLGILDPEGIHHDATSGHLFVAGKDETVLYEIAISGIVTTPLELIRTFDIAAANALRPAGVTLAPGSVNPGRTNLYIVDRGLDNNSVPNENDGTLYEFTLDPGSLAIMANPTHITANGTSTSTITVQVNNVIGHPMAGETVAFKTTLGSISPALAITDAAGVATATLTTGTITGTTTGTATIATPGTAYVTARIGNITDTTTVIVVAELDGAITSVGNDIHLTWPEVSTVDTYEIHRSTTPFFMPVTNTLRAALPAGSTAYTDTGASGNADISYFYKERGLDAGGNLIASFVEVGAITYPLNNAGDKYSMVAIPFRSTTITDAAALANTIGNVGALLKWNPLTESFRFFAPPSSGDNFSLATGDVVFLLINRGGPDKITMTGKVMAIQYSLASSGLNFLSMPLQRSDLIDASSTAASITNVTAMRGWNKVTQKFRFFAPPNAGDNFPLRLGSPFIVQLAANGSTVWPLGNQPSEVR